MTCTQFLKQRAETEPMTSFLKNNSTKEWTWSRGTCGILMLWYRKLYVPWWPAYSKTRPCKWELRSKTKSIESRLVYMAGRRTRKGTTHLQVQGRRFRLNHHVVVPHRWHQFICPTNGPPFWRVETLTRKWCKAGWTSPHISRCRHIPAGPRLG